VNIPGFIWTLHISNALADRDHICLILGSTAILHSQFLPLELCLSSTKSPNEYTSSDKFQEFKSRILMKIENILKIDLIELNESFFF